VLKEVQNALADGGEELTVTRALGGWKAGGRIERDFAAAKEAFSKTKFVYLEMSTKHEFVTEIVNGGGLSLERPESRASDEASCEQTRANLANLDELTATTSGPTGRGSITPARKAPNRRHSQSTEDLTPSRRSERIAKQKCSSTGR
jgi:hypothetical protein